MARQRTRRMEESALGTEAEDVPFNLDSFNVPLREWVHQETTRAEVKRRFVSCASSCLGVRRFGVSRRWKVNSALSSRLACWSSAQRNFLQTYTDEGGHNIYEPIIERMCAQNGQVSRLRLSNFSRVPLSASHRLSAGCICLLL